MSDKPAFPVAEDHKVASDFEWTCGMSIRDYFAAKAMQGLMAAQIHGFTDQPANGPFAEMAYNMADAMLAQREK